MSEASRPAHGRAREGWVYLYALAEPDNPQELRYIGKSKDPRRRLMHHLCPAALAPDTYKNRWLRPLAAAGRKPALLILKEVPEQCWQAEEAVLIAHYRARGMRLTNLTDGGEGCTGYVQSAATRALHGLTWRGRKHRPESIEKLKSAAAVRPPQTAEARRRGAQTRTGRKGPPMPAHVQEACRLGRRRAAEARQAARLAAAQDAAPAAPKRRSSAEQLAQLRTLNMGRKRTPTTLARMAAAQQERRATERAVALAAMAVQPDESFGTHLRRLRLYAGLSLRRLQAATGLHRAILAAMEQDRHAPPRADGMARLAAALQVPVEALAARAAAAGQEPEP